MSLSALFTDRDTRSELAKAAYVDKVARAQQRHHEKLIAAAERKDAADARAARRRTAVRTFFRLLPERLILVPVVLATVAAWIGQYQWAFRVLHWPQPFAAGLATALETFGLAMAALARRARNDDDSAAVERSLMWFVVGSAAYLNFTHISPVLGLMSIVGVAGWEVYERRQHRTRLANFTPRRLPARRPKFGPARWVRYPSWTYRAWSIALRDRLLDPTDALDLARLEMDAPGGTRADRKWLDGFRTDMRNLIAELDHTPRLTGTTAAPEPVTGTGDRNQSTGTKRRNQGAEPGTTTPEPTNAGTGKAGSSAGTAKTEPKTGTRQPEPVSSPTGTDQPTVPGVAAAKFAFASAAHEDRLDDFKGSVIAELAGISDSMGRRYLRNWKQEAERDPNLVGQWLERYQPETPEPKTGTDN